jgi:hypothetical protein
MPLQNGDRPYRHLSFDQALLLLGRDNRLRRISGDQQRPPAVAGIEPPVTFHGLRHTWASQRIMQGLPVMVAASRCFGVLADPSPAVPSMDGARRPDPAPADPQGRCKSQCGLRTSLSRRRARPERSVLAPHHAGTSCTCGPMTVAAAAGSAPHLPASSYTTGICCSQPRVPARPERSLASRQRCSYLELGNER